MSAHLLPLKPFQKLIDVPESLRRYRVPLRALAIAEICASVLLLPAIQNVFNGVVILLSIIGASVVLCNTNLWASEDVCCNLVRPYPTCCSKSCGAPRTCCCSRLSAFHFATTGFTMFTNVLNIFWAMYYHRCVWAAVCGFLFIFGCLIASGILLRKIEIDLAPIALLPPNKMVCATPPPVRVSESVTRVTGIPVAMTNVAIKLEQCE